MGKFLCAFRKLVSAVVSYVLLLHSQQLQLANFADLNANFLSLQNLSAAFSAERVHTFPNKPATLIKGRHFCGFHTCYCSCHFVRRLFFILNVQVMQHFRSFTLLCLLVRNSVNFAFPWRVQQNACSLKFRVCPLHSCLPEKRIVNVKRAENSQRWTIPFVA
jgi:hypothetical protein